MINNLIDWVRERVVSICGVKIISATDLLEQLEFIKQHEVVE